MHTNMYFFCWNIIFPAKNEVFLFLQIFFFKDENILQELNNFRNGMSAKNNFFV